MNQPTTLNLINLNDCGCCQGLEVETPREINNLPGLSAIAYRVGNQAQFKQSLLAQLSTAQRPALQGLRTREDDDFAIALLDAWATLCDVLTFYQERIANEAYLRTATERLSLLYLAQLIGYKLRPGVAANTYLAFTLEDTPTAPSQVTLDIGTKVQSVPEPGEQPQTYETIEKLEARADWNAIKPRLSKRHPLPNPDDSEHLFLKGITTGLQAGDSLLIIPEDKSEDNSRVMFRQIAQVIPQPEQHRTKVKLQALPTENVLSLEQPEVVWPSQQPLRAEITESLMQQTEQTINAADLQTMAKMKGFSVQSIFKNVIASEVSPPKVLAFRSKAAIFGHNAPKWENLFYVLREGELVYEKVEDTSTESSTYEIKQNVVDGIYKERNQDNWADTSLDKYLEYLKQYDNEPTDSTNIYLDNVYPKIVKDSWVVLKDDITKNQDNQNPSKEISKWKNAI